MCVQEEVTVSGFSVDKLKGKQLLLKFRPDAQDVFRAKVKLGTSLDV